MAVTKIPPSLLPLLVHILAFVLTWGESHEDTCLQDGKHKVMPSAEPYLKECSLYAENACCSQDDIEDAAESHSSGVENIFWDNCGPVPLSPSCEGFLRRVACFRLCSPDATRWPHPGHPGSFQAVPLCHSFCKDWYEACKTDTACILNTAGDWEWHPQRGNCTGNCVTFRKMYQDSRALCEGIWEGAFVAVEEEDADGEGASCGCLTLSPSDREVIAALRAQEEDPDELDTTKTGLPQYRAPCRTQSQMPGATVPPQTRGSADGNTMHKRSVFVEDVEGSGSGF